MGELDAVIQCDDRALGHRAGQAGLLDEVAQPAIGAATDAIDAGNDGQGAVDGVVLARGATAGDVMQTGRQHVHEHLTGLHGRRIGDIAVLGWGVIRGDEGRFQTSSFGTAGAIVRNTT